MEGWIYCLLPQQCCEPSSTIMKKLPRTTSVYYCSWTYRACGLFAAPTWAHSYTWSAPERAGSSANLGWPRSCVWRWLAAGWSRMVLPGTAGLSCAWSFMLNLAGLVLLVKSEFQEKEWKVLEPMLRTDPLSFFCILLARANQRPAWIQRGEGIDSTSLGGGAKDMVPGKGIIWDIFVNIQDNLR